MSDLTHDAITELFQGTDVEAILETLNTITNEYDSAEDVYQLFGLSVDKSSPVRLYKALRSFPHRNTIFLWLMSKIC